MNSSNMTKFYATVTDDSDCKTFREIADLMTKNGDKMNHASARNHILRAMRKFAEIVGKANGKRLTDIEIEVQASDPTFQAAVGCLLQDYYCFEGNLDS